MSSPADAVRPAPAVSALYAAICATAWWAVAGDDPGSWVIGIPAIGAAVWASHRLAPLSWPGVSPLRLLPFWLRFCRSSLLAGIDVARRALLPRVRLEPGLLRYRTRLPDAAPRHLFMAMISLVPGTLTADLTGDVLTVHVLDRRLDNYGDIYTLERDIAILFGLGSDWPTTPPAASPSPPAADGVCHAPPSPRSTAAPSLPGSPR